MTHHTILTLIFCFVLFSQCASVKNNRLAERNKETIRIWIEEGWNNNRNEELLDRCFDPEWEDGNPLRPDQITGHEGMRQMYESYKKGASDAHFTITHLFADESRVAMRYELAATHSGDLFGMPPTGKQFVSTGIILYEMENERIKVTWQEMDIIGLMNQLKN